MSKLVPLTIASVLLLSLLACSNTAGNEAVRVKCPACGYEFDFDGRG